jgi:hypothetical protein
MTKNWKKIYSCNICKKILDRKLHFTYTWAFIKDSQATEETFSPQKRTSSTSEHENSLLFSIFVGHFLPTWIRIRIQIRIQNGADPDPETQINADPNPDPQPRG